MSMHLYKSKTSKVPINRIQHYVVAAPNAPVGFTKKRYTTGVPKMGASMLSKVKSVKQYC